MSLTLSLAKDGEAKPKLSLNLSKPAKFRVEMWWESQHDLDVHALLATNNGDGAKVSSFEQVLSTYNCKKTNKQGTLPANADGSFQTPEGALFHSPDEITGLHHTGDDVDEFIEVDGSKMPSGANEIPLFVTIHPSGKVKFAEVKEAGIRIRDSGGAVLAEYKLSDQFGQFDAVQMGSLILDDAGWHYEAVGVGFNGDFNMILGSFS